MLAVPQILISAVEASADMYAAWLLEAVRERMPEAVFFGCAGDRLRAAGCETVVDAHRISTVGVFEILKDVPRIYRQFLRLVGEAKRRRPALAVLVDAPGFNLHVARRMKRLGVPVLYFIAPQLWAWRPWRVGRVRRWVDRLLCIFPFEEKWFRERRVPAEYIGHPLAWRVRPTESRSEFLRRWNLREDKPLVVLLPGSRRREIALNLPRLVETARHVRAQCAVVAAPGVQLNGGGLPVITGATWDALAHADVAVAASGTVTIEAALLGIPLVVVYRVTEPSWLVGRLLVRTPFYSMVNLVAGRQVVPEFIQKNFAPARVAEEANRLLESPPARAEMRAGLAEVARRLATEGDPIARAAQRTVEMVEGRAPAATLRPVRIGA